MVFWCFVKPFWGVKNDVISGMSALGQKAALTRWTNLYNLLAQPTSAAAVVHGVALGPTPMVS